MTTNKQKRPATADAQANKKRVTNMVRFIARHKQVPPDEVWAQVVQPAVAVEFERCVNESRGPARKG